MALDHATFFAYARRAPFGGRLTQLQVDGCEALLAAWAADGDDDDRKLANVLAQVFHETGGRMVPVRETFATSDAQAIRRLAAAWRAGQLPQVRVPYWTDGWFGRGPIQVTHKRNYVKMGAALGIDLVAKPGLLLDPVIGARSAVVGMMQGLFTGRRLSDYFSPSKSDPAGARHIVNGTDKASLIAGYHANFLDAIKAARVEAQKPTPVPDAVVEAAKPDSPKLATDKTTIGGMLAGLGGLGGIAAFAKPILEGIANPWAFAAFVLIAVGVFLVVTGRVEIRRRAGA